MEEDVTEDKPIAIPTADMEIDPEITGVEECNINKDYTPEFLQKCKKMAIQDLNQAIMQITTIHKEKSQEWQEMHAKTGQDIRK